METSKFSGLYEYLGFAIYNAGSRHEWDIEPIGWDIRAIERWKASSFSFRTLAQAKKWIRENADNIKESDYKA